MVCKNITSMIPKQEAFMTDWNWEMAQKWKTYTVVFLKYWGVITDKLNATCTSMEQLNKGKMIAVWDYSLSSLLQCMLLQCELICYLWVVG